MKNFLLRIVILVFPIAAFAGNDPLCPDEEAALRFLDKVASPMSDEEEREWWQNVGQDQTGLFARRYNIAFVGYAAAALGTRANHEQTNVVVRILRGCVNRMLRQYSWIYAPDSYWRDAPWKPDPCYRENVMYTGHLLQLLAYYERYSGDRVYWEKGFDFHWRDGSLIHYDVQKLIDVTVAQMRGSPSGGVTCEPGTIFFPCNNHPHVALKVFSTLGHGDWTAESTRWEKWALKNFLYPAFGGGAFNLAYYVKTGIFVPRGHSALDAWSLLWYSVWASDPEKPKELWRVAARKIDWDEIDRCEDPLKVPGGSCCDIFRIPATATACFIAPAARICGDVKSAERAERALDKRYLVRKDGLYYLNLNREWRIGASANRIIALALEHGSVLR